MTRTISVTTPLRVLLAGAGLATVALLSGCATGTTVGGASSVLSSTTPSSTDPSAGPSTTPPSTTPADPVTPGAATNTSDTAFASARAQWVKGATAISAEQGIYWAEAAAYLAAGVVTGGDTAGYTAAAKQLTNLISLPDGQQTPAQNAEYHAAINALNTFFNTPGLYS